MNLTPYIACGAVALGLVGAVVAFMDNNAAAVAWALGYSMWAACALAMDRS